MRRSWRMLVALLCAAGSVMGAAAACSSSGSRPTTSPSPTAVRTLGPSEAPPSPVRWSACGNGFNCGTVSVPVDYADPTGRRLSLAVSRRPADAATGQRGVLVVDFGGPAISGAATLKLAAALVPEQLRARFDLVSFDPRGSGGSGRLACGAAGAQAQLVGAAVGAPPTAPPGQPLPVSGVYARVHAACAQSDGALTGALGSRIQARDLDRIRAALGAERISYLGLSYGSVLGLAYAGQFPSHLDRMVLDSPVDPTQPFGELAQQQAAAAEGALSRAFTGKLAGQGESYDRLQARLARAPLPAPAGDPTPVSSADLQYATLTYLQTPALTPTYPAALQAALGGDGKELRSLAASQYQDVDGAPIVGAYWATLCADSNERPSPDAANTASRALATRYPRLGAVAYAFAGGGCTAWPPTHDAVSLPRAPGPLLLVAGTGDPITPYASAVGLVHKLPGALLLTRVGEGHAALDNASGDTCVTSGEVAFLLNGQAPARNRCTDPAS